MPGHVHEGVPNAIPLVEVMKAGPLPCANGEASGAEGAEAAVQEELTCLECGGKTNSIRACGGCWQAWYCSRAHQVQGWPKHRRACRPWKIVVLPVLGRCLLASRDIKAGELILDDAPLMIGPKQITEPVCLACYRPVDGKYSCQKCGFPMCDENCSHADAHQPECRAIQESGVKVKVSVFGETNSMYECITPIRLLNLRDSNPSVWSAIQNMESHLEKRDGTEVAAIEQRTIVDIILRRLQLTQYSEELIQKVCGILDTNAFEIRLPDSSIQGVFYEGALLEHSCIPNTHRTFDADLHLIIRAAVSIKRGEHLTSCYTDSLSSTAVRQDHLLTSKFFTCICLRCVDPTEIGTYASAMLCPNCTSGASNNKTTSSNKKEENPPGGGSKGEAASSHEMKGIVLPQDPQSPSSLWVCTTCESPLDQDYVTRMIAVITEEAEELDSSPTVQTCEAFLEKWKEVLHPNHALFLNVKYALLHLYGSEDSYTFDDMTPFHILRKEDLCRQVLRIADILTPGISRLRGSVFYELYQALFYKSCSMYQAGVISNEMARKLAQESYDCLLECARVLSYEPPVQPEGQLGIEAKEQLRQMITFMKEEQWKG